MSEDLPQPQQSEEVDLGQLFKLIGNAFDRFFNFIGSIFSKFFLAFVWSVFFIKKHFIKIVVAGILGFGYGLLKEKKGQPVYKSTTVIKQNYKTGENLYRAIDYYNELIEDEDSITLGSVLNISSKKASSIMELSAESVITENDKLENFDGYIKNLDSAIASTVKFAEYVNNSKEFQYPIQRIIIKAKEKDIFGTVVLQIVDKIVSTEYFLNEQKKDLGQLESLEKTVNTSLEASEVLQLVYKKVLETPLENTSGTQTSITIDNTEDKSKTKEFELYNNDVKLRRELVEIQRAKEDKQHIIEIISSQENQGTIDNTVDFFSEKIDGKIFYAFILMILISIILFGIHFIKFLEKYKSEI